MELRWYIKSAVPKDELVTQLGSQPGSAEGSAQAQNRNHKLKAWKLLFFLKNTVLRITLCISRRIQSPAQTWEREQECK